MSHDLPAQADLRESESAQSYRRAYAAEASFTCRLFVIAALSLFCFALTSTLASIAFGQEAGALKVELPKTEPEKPRYDLSGKLVVSTSRTLSENESPSYAGAYTGNLVFADTKNSIAGSAEIIYSREYSYETEDGHDDDFSNPAFVLSKKFSNEKDFNTFLIDSLSVGLTSSVGMNREAKRRTLLGSLGLSMSVAKQISKFGLKQGLSYSRGFYEYDIRDNGVVNSPDSFKSTTAVEYQISDQWSASLQTVLTHALSFQGVLRTTELSAIEIGYSPSEVLGFALGVSIERGTLDPDGQGNRVKFFDREGGQGYFDMVMAF